MATDQPGKFDKIVRATAAKPMSLFPDQGLIMKVLLDRIGELWMHSDFNRRTLDGWRL